MASSKFKVEDLVDMTAMVDIVFFVLIFFMVTSMQGVFSSISLPAPTRRKSPLKATIPFPRSRRPTT